MLASLHSPVAFSDNLPQPEDHTRRPGSVSTNSRLTDSSLLYGSPRQSRLSQSRPPKNPNGVRSSALVNACPTLNLTSTAGRDDRGACSVFSMEEHVEKTCRKVDRAESDLATQIQAEPPVYTALEPALSKLRDASETLFFLSLEAVTSQDVENRLWVGHHRVSKIFKDYLVLLRQDRKKAVERRKAEKLYLDFIKSSQRFYRGLIQRVASHYQGLDEIVTVAQKMHLDLTSVDAPVEVSPSQRQRLVRSCYMALIKCGDLSRYRELELNHKERNWGPAKGYYECALELDPTSGHAFNQMIVIAHADEDHFRTLYYVYRALAMPKRFPDAKGNLAVAFKKLNKGIKPAKIDTKLDDSEVPFLDFHRKSYAPGNTTSVQSDIDGLISKLEAAVISQPCNSSLRKLCIINIVASKHALESAQEGESAEVAATAADAWKRLQSLNIGIFLMFLRLFSKELFGITTKIGGRLTDVPQSIAHLTPICRRVLPCLRLYSAWLISDLQVLHQAAAVGTTFDLATFWDKYADCLSYLSEMFPVADILDVPYNLDEEKDTLFFTPFNERARKFLHLDSQGEVKSNRDQSNALLVPDAQRPDMEMLFRIKGLLRIGVYLVKHPDDFGPITIPLIFEDNQFEYQSPSSENGTEDKNQDCKELPPNGAVRELEGGIARTSTDQIQDMVDDLVGPDPAASNPRSPLHTGGFAVNEDSNSPSHRPASGAFTASDLVRQMSQGSPARTFATPSQQRDQIPSYGFGQDPFAPLQGELSGSMSGSRPSTSHQTTSPRLGYHRSSGFFNDELTKRQREIDTRTSPLVSMEPSSAANSPIYAFPQNRSRPSLQQDQWQSPFTSPADPGDIARKGPTPSRFGAIGDSRPAAARTPTSGQPG